MPSPRQSRSALTHPSRVEIELLDVLRALADPTRMTVVRTLYDAPERACGTFPVDVAPSTLSHHFKVLREAGVIHQREEGNRKLTRLRRADLDARFPGLIETILRASASPTEEALVPIRMG